MYAIVVIMNVDNSLSVYCYSHVDKLKWNNEYSRIVDKMISIR